MEAGHLQILIVEDDPDQRILMAHLLGLLGYKDIHYVGDGPAAIDFARKHEPGLILMDIGLGSEPDGIGAAREIYECQPTPIVYVTSMIDESTIDRAGQAGTFGYLIKPISKAKLRASIEMALHQFNQSKQLRSLVERLSESESRYRAMFDNTLAITLLINPGTGQLLDANPAAVEYYGYSHEQLMQMSIYDINTLTRLEITREMHRARVSNRNYFHFRHRLASGEIRDVEIYSNPIKIDGKDFLYSIVHDITERRRAEEKLKLSSIVFENTIEGIWITDSNFAIINVNRAFNEITGYSIDEVRGMNPGMLTAGRNEQDFHKQMWTDLNQNGFWQGEIWNRRKNGESYPEWLTITRVTDHANQPKNFVGVFSDITRRKLAEEKLNYMATHDGLTDLPNRTFLNEHLRQSLLKANRQNWMVAVFFLDLDRFKNLNDTMGHQIGDVLLQKVAARIKDSIRESDTVARIGGDEFVIVFEDVGNTQNAARLAQKIIDIIEKPFIISEREIFISTSIGISVAPNDSSDAIQLLRNADIAMYRVKQRGRSGFEFFQEEMHAEAQDKATIEHDLRKAIPGDQFYLDFQPIVDLKERRILGAEALIRWKHPERGLISPGRFIPIAEETGLITSISEWVMRNTIQTINLFEALGMHGFYISVNLSARHLHLHNLINYMQTLIETVGISPHHLVVEVTESAMMHEPEVASRILSEMNKLGIRIAIDDFGTGYSSLSYLQQIPFDIIKIDRSFLSNITNNGKSQALIRSIAGIARGMQKTIIVEGVEDPYQLRFLRSEGLYNIQGYYIGKPENRDHLRNLLETYKETLIPEEGHLQPQTI